MPTSLHSPTYLHGERPTSSGSGCVFAARPANWWPFVMRPVPGGESAGCVRLQYLFSRLCLPACHFACHAHCPSQRSCPHSSLLCPRPFRFIVLCPRSIPCAPGSPLSRAGDFFQSGPAVCKLRTVPLAAATRACSGGPCTGPFVTYLTFFPAESMILGHEVV